LTSTKKGLIHPGPAARGKRPKEVPAVVHVDIVPDQDDPVDRVPGLVVEDEVADPSGEVLRVGLRGAELRCVALDQFDRRPSSRPRSAPP